MPAPCLNPDLGAHRGPMRGGEGPEGFQGAYQSKLNTEYVGLTATMTAPVESSAVHFPIAQRYSADVLTFSTHQGVNRPAPSKFFPLSLMPFVSVSLLDIVLSFPAS